MIAQLRRNLERKKGERQRCLSEYKRIRASLSLLKQELQYSKKAQLIIQKVAKETQEQLQIHISSLVSTALKAVYKNPYKFICKFEIKRGKTECKLLFERNSKKIDPLLASGGGVVDVASFALRVALWSLAPQKSRNVLILDEPFKNINDKSRVLHQKLSEMVKMISKKLNIQMIIISMIPEMENIADKIFRIKLKKGVSYGRGTFKRRHR
mgnify:FL=1